MNTSFVMKRFARFLIALSVMAIGVAQFSPLMSTHAVAEEIPSPAAGQGTRSGAVRR